MHINSETGSRKLLIFSLSAAVLALMIFAAVEYFEIYTEPVWEGPSLKAQTNPYLALQLWLEKAGRSVHVMKKADESIFDQPGILCVQASRLAWTENLNAKLFSWVRDGGFIFLYWDKDLFENTGLKNLLKELGIRVQPASGKQASRRMPDTEGFPDFDQGFILKPVKENPNRPRMVCRKDSGGVIRLISVPLGKGAIAAGAAPRFMRSRDLKKAENSRLAWELTGAKDIANQGIIFIHDRNAKDSMYESFSAKGSLAPLIISALILVIIGFWMVIPVFGRVKEDAQKPGRPLQERFLAEGSFLKKFGALESYLDMYKKEIQFKSRLGEGLDPKSLAGRLAPLCGMDERTIYEALAPQNGINFREFVKRRKILKTLWERL
jgi:hypothetical protein